MAIFSKLTTVIWDITSVEILNSAESSHDRDLLVHEMYMAGKTNGVVNYDSTTDAWIREWLDEAAATEYLGKLQEHAIKYSCTIISSVISDAPVV
jgi:hypothetical protein